MRFLHLLPLAVVASTFIIPDETTLNSLTLENQEPVSHSIFDSLPEVEDAWTEFEDGFTQAAKCAKQKFDEALDLASESLSDTVAYYSDKFETAFDGEAWLNTADYDLDLVDGPPPHHGPPGHGPPGRRPPGRGKPPHKKPKKPHHPPPHHKSNMSVYELIAKSKYTTKLAEAINEFDDLVELLNGTTANFTVFAPTNRAFDKIPKGAPKPSKEFLKKLLTYHVSPEFYPAGRVFFSRTIPTALEASAIGKVPQRLSTQIGLRGLTINFYARIVAVNIFATNGVIHGIDSFLLPPPKAVDILSFLPQQFSTLELGLMKTGLYAELNETTSRSGGTLFAPSNGAFAMLGPKANAFLFSKFGEKYLKALLMYHMGSNITLYSDAIYKGDSNEAEQRPGMPKGIFHVDLPTALTGKALSIDIARYGRFITIKINGFNKVSVSDGIAADGVIHVVPHVLIPPKTPGMLQISNEDISVEELQERLEPYVVVEDIYETEL